jgi:hypothetical protein
VTDQPSDASDGPSDQTDDPEVALTVALAEYEHLREARRAVSDQSAARFNFFLVIASAGTAVSAGLVGAAAESGLGSGRAGTIVGIGALVLLLGVAVFARQVEYNLRSRRYAVAETVLRTYLMRRSPGLSRYVLMPTLDDAGPFAAEPFRRHWLRDVVGLAGTVGMVNSALLAVGLGLGLAGPAPWWVAAVAGVAVMVAAVAAHVGYVRRRLAGSVAQVGEVLARRGLSGPGVPRARTPGAPTRPAGRR